MQPDKIFNVSQTQFSIARHYGGITLNGARYVYNPVEDSLTRADLLKKPKAKPNVSATAAAAAAPAATATAVAEVPTVPDTPAPAAEV